MILNYNKKSNKEINKHGSPSLPYDIYGTYIPLFLQNFPMHWHEELEIVYVVDGTARYIVDCDEYIINKGDILIIPPNSLHAFEQFENCNFAGKAFLFSKKMVDNNSLDICSIKYITPLFSNDLYFTIHIKNDSIHGENLRKYLDSAVQSHKSKNTGYELRVRIAFLEFIQYCYENGLYTASYHYDNNQKSAEQIKLLTNYISEHYSEKITLEDLANLVNLSTYHMAHIFKQYTGISPNKYINEHRLAISANRLLNENLPILNIALECGFNNISYFNRAFKNKYEMTPNEFRKVKK